jgi:hypothetical protein
VTLTLKSTDDGCIDRASDEPASSARTFPIISAVMAGKLALMTTQPTAALLGRCCVRQAGGPFFWVQPRLTPAGLEMRRELRSSIAATAPNLSADRAHYDQ